MSSPFASLTRVPSQPEKDVEFDASLCLVLTHLDLGPCDVIVDRRPSREARC